MSKVTAIFGASPNEGRYSNMAARMLSEYDHPIVPLGQRKGLIANKDIIVDWPDQIDNLDTLTMYVGPARQPEHYAYLLSLKPKRIIFNPGAENPELEALAAIQGVEVVNACTLVMLRTGQY